MKKLLISLILSTFMVGAFAACGNSDGKETPATDSSSSTAASEVSSEVVSESSEVSTPAEVTITDFDGKEITVKTNPTTVAIYDYSILDILNSIGFEKTGITKLIVPSKDTLPEALSFYKEQGDDTVITGGSLFYVDWDVLDLAQPELVILGGRSFGMNGAGDRLSGDEKTKFQDDTFSRYPEADFLKLTVNSSNSQLLSDMENNVAVLSAIFPDLADEFKAEVEAIKADVAVIHEKAANSGKTALFAMMVDQTTLSIFNTNSRFDMLFEEFGFQAVDSEATEWGDQHGFDVRAEYVLEKNPDVIFILDRSATVGSGAGAENFMNDPIIKQTSAAASGDIYVLSGDAWYTMTGGFSSIRQMIDDINQYMSKLAE